MSTHIIDQMAAVQICEKLNDYHDVPYIVAFEGGDNNVIECLTNRRARSWYPVACGNHNRCIQRIIHCSADIEGGCTRLYGDRSAKPETMIRRMRNVMASAPLLGSPKAKFYLTEAKISFTPDEMVSLKYDYERLLEKRGEPVIDAKSNRVFTFRHHDPADMSSFTELIPYGMELYQCLRVHGRH